MIHVIAEIGINHGGSFEKACRMIEHAAKCGVDSVKFQTFKGEKLYSSYFKSQMNENTKGINFEIIDFFRQFELKEDDFVRLKKCADDNGVNFMSTAFDAESFDFLLSLGSKKIKIASGSFNDIFLIERAARSKAEIIASTGMCSLDEIKKVSEIFKAHKSDYTLLHCVSVYPPSDAEVNLSRMLALKNEACCHVGFSDHSKDFLASVSAAAMGADVIEKHFMLSGDDCPDAPVSMEPAEFTRMVEMIRRVETMKGTGEIEPRAKEKEVAKGAKMSLVAARKITRGEIIERSMLTAKRPGTGISPLDIEKITGKKTVEDIEADSIIDIRSLK